MVACVVSRASAIDNPRANRLAVLPLLYPPCYHIRRRNIERVK